MTTHRLVLNKPSQNLRHFPSLITFLFFSLASINSMIGFPSHRPAMPWGNHVVSTKKPKSLIVKALPCHPPPTFTINLNPHAGRYSSTMEHHGSTVTPLYQSTRAWSKIQPPPTFKQPVEWFRAVILEREIGICSDGVPSRERSNIPPIRKETHLPNFLLNGICQFQGGQIVFKMYVASYYHIV